MRGPSRRWPPTSALIPHTLRWRKPSAISRRRSSSDVGHRRSVHRKRRPRDGWRQRAPGRVSAVEPDEQERVHGGAGDRGPTAGRSSPPAARSSRSSIVARRSDRPGQQRVHLSRRRARPLGRAACDGHQRDVPRGRAGAGRPGEGGPRRRRGLSPVFAHPPVSGAVACACIRRGVAEGHAAPEMLSGLEETVRLAMWFAGIPAGSLQIRRAHCRVIVSVTVV